jgi:hypothetical protein
MVIYNAEPPVNRRLSAPGAARGIVRVSQKGEAMLQRVAMGVAAVLLGAATAFAAGPKEYQVTGPVLDLTSDVITVENKDKEKWEIARNKDTKVTGELKKGARVTIKYTMTAASVEVKDAGKGDAKKSK